MDMIPLQHDTIPAADALAAAKAFARTMAARRSVRCFDSAPIDRSIIEACISAAGAAPSGANKQPWRFVAVSDTDLKRRIRAAAEAEERAFYEDRASADWLADLAPLETGPEKPFLEEAPWLIVVFKLMKDDRDDRLSDRVYYVEESVGIAVGILLAAIHHAGLVALTHTPSPMKFLCEVLDRPDHERAFMLIPVGYPASDCQVPDIARKGLDEIALFHEGEAP